MALRAEVALAAARVADELGLTSDGGAGGEALVTYVVRGVDGLFDRAWREECARWRGGRLSGAPSSRSERLTKILPSRKPDGGVERSEAAEANRKGGHWRSRAQGAIFLLKNGRKLGSHHV